MSAQPMPEVEGVTHRNVKLSEITIHVAEAGEGGVPIVLVHGWPQHWWEWRELIGPLAEDRRIICPDLRGFGWSEAPGHGYDPLTFGRDLIALLDAEGIEQADLVGHDWGGWAVQFAALQNPERVRRVMVLNMPPPFINSPLLKTLAGGWRYWYQGAVSIPLVNRPLIRSVGRRHNPVGDWMGRSAWSPQEARVFGHQFRDPGTVQASAKLYRWLLAKTPKLAIGAFRDHRFEMPVRYLHGTGDRIVRPHLFDGVERHGDDVEVEFVPGVGHFIADEVPELVVDRIRAFMA